MRPSWTANAFARRVMISSRGLWVLVEGRVTDVVFYDRILTANACASKVGFRVRLVETLDLQTTAGGKSAALQLFEYFRRGGRLAQANSAGARSIVFMLDKDLDDVTGSRARHSHVIYTRARDAEAELHLHGDLKRALATAMSLSDTEARDLMLSLSGHVADLASAWREWLTLGAVSAGLRSRCSVRTGKPSTVNVDTYGPLDTTAHAAALSDVLAGAQVPNPPARRRQIEARVSARYARGDHVYLVKGRWLPAYVDYRVRQLVPAKTPLDYAGLASLGKCLLETMDFSGTWAKHYHDAVDAVAC